MQLVHDFSMKHVNTFGIDEKCFAFAIFTNIEELIELLQYARDINKELRVLGGGSNILFTEYGDYILAQNCIKGIKILHQDDEYVTIKANAGEQWHDLVMYCVKNNFQGIENMALIPGTCGAAPIQNIGAYGVEIKDFFVELEAINRKDYITKVFSNLECKFGYRDSVFKNELKNQYVISSITLKLNKSPQYKISYGDIQKVLAEKELELNTQNIANAIISIRKTKLPNPSEIGNAGSFFKNPSIEKQKLQVLDSKFPNIPSFELPNEMVKIPAAWLIEQCGWKGYTENNYGVHKNQALVLVNYGGANGSSILNLSTRIIESVKEKLDIDLEREVNIW